MVCLFTLSYRTVFIFMCSAHSLPLLVVLLYFLQELILFHRIWRSSPYFLLKLTRFLLFLGFLYTCNWSLCVIGSKDLIYSSHISVQLIQYHVLNNKAVIHLHCCFLTFLIMKDIWKVHKYKKRAEHWFITKHLCVQNPCQEIEHCKTTEALLVPLPQQVTTVL